MLLVPTAAVASQTFGVVLANQAANVQLFTRRGKLYFTVSLGGDPIVTNRICRNKQRLLVDAQYRGFVGDFFFVDMQGDTDPAYTGLGTRYILVYIEASDLE